LVTLREKAENGGFLSKRQELQESKKLDPKFGSNFDEQDTDVHLESEESKSQFYTRKNKRTHLIQFFSLFRIVGYCHQANSSL